MKKVFLVLTFFCLISGCAGLDSYVGKTLDGGIDYESWLKGQAWLKFDLIHLRLDEYDIHEDHDTLIFTVIKKEAPAEYGSFNNNFDQYGTELTLRIYMLDENRVCFKKISQFRRMSSLPGKFKINIPHDSRLKYFVPYYHLRWYYQS